MAKQRIDLNKIRSLFSYYSIYRVPYIKYIYSGLSYT